MLRKSEYRAKKPKRWKIGEKIKIYQKPGPGCPMPKIEVPERINGEQKREDL